MKRQSPDKAWIFTNQRMKVHLPFVAGFACNDKPHLEGLDLAAPEINGKTSMHFGKEGKGSERLHTRLGQSHLLQMQ